MTTDGLTSFSQSFPGILDGTVCLFQPDTSFGKVEIINGSMEVFQYFCQKKNGTGLCESEHFVYIGHQSGLYRFRCTKCQATLDFNKESRENLYWSRKPNEVTPEQ